MIILPERGRPRGKLLLPQRQAEWRAPSQRSSLWATENQTRFRLTARLHDGYVVWRGWFDDRDDADAFLFALVSGSLCRERALWRLPAPGWRPGLGERLVYDFATVTFLTTTGANTYNVPSDWNTSNNTIECLGAGGGGAAGNGGTGTAAAGGGAGAYSRIANLALAGGGTASYTVGAKGAGGATSNATGGTGGDTFFNAASLASSSVGAKGGTGGNGKTGGTGGEQTGNTGGVGTTKRLGGNGGASTTSTDGGGGGGGAAGPTAAGGNGASANAGAGHAFGGNGGGGADNGSTGNGTQATTANGGAGGNGGNTGGSVAGTGGAASSGAGNPGSSSSSSGGGGGSGGHDGTSASPANIGGAGGSGTEWDGSHGAGGGGGGGAGNQSGASSAGGAAGSYGGGGGGGEAWSANWAAGGDGAQGLIVTTYTSFVFLAHSREDVRPARSFYVDPVEAQAPFIPTPQVPVSGMAWMVPPDVAATLPRKPISVEAPSAVALTPSTLPPKISGMEWFEPWDHPNFGKITFTIAPSFGFPSLVQRADGWLRQPEDPVPLKPKYVEQQLGAALTPATLPPKVSGIAWFEPPDVSAALPRRPLWLEAPQAETLTPATLPPKIAGMAWHEPPDVSVRLPMRPLTLEAPAGMTLAPLPVVVSIVITSGTTFMVPSNFLSLVAIEGIGGGGPQTLAVVGGGGAYAAIFALPGIAAGNVYNIQIGVGNGSVGSGTSPTNNTWFADGSTLVAAGADTNGGSVANSVGTVLFAGANGGGGGAGGAAGPHGAGQVGSGGDGGAGDAGFGGAGGTSGSINGKPGTEMRGGVGAGGGSRSTGGNGGLFGGGSNGTFNRAGQGVIVFTYIAQPTPVSGIAWFEPLDYAALLPRKPIAGEAPVALALTPATLPVKVSGIAWFGQPDYAALLPRKPVTVEAPAGIALTPPPPISVVVVTSGTTFTVPDDFVSFVSAQAIGAGATPGGGGAFAEIDALPGAAPGVVYALQIGMSGGTDGSGTSPTANTWFKDGSTLVAAGSASITGGTVANSVGTKKFAGGNAPDNSTSGGGGAAGPHGAGVDATNFPTGGGGAGDAGFGGAGGVQPGGAGASGTEMLGGVGAGGGGGSGDLFGGSSGGPGGNFGAGAGVNTGGGDTGSGANGVFVFAYIAKSILHMAWFVPMEAAIPARFASYAQQPAFTLTPPGFGIAAVVDWIIRNRRRGRR